ncbi:hypothetical protein [Aeromonas dhakensis]|uniref:hypothetical protein n=1 Tax=Aeromonas dhakensis TaxID=196024 RepID=UPI003985FEF6
MSIEEALEQVIIKRVEQHACHARHTKRYTGDRTSARYKDPRESIGVAARIR